jgi:hypothetical protein
VAPQPAVLGSAHAPGFYQLQFLVVMIGGRLESKKLNAVAVKGFERNRLGYYFCVYKRLKGSVSVTSPPGQELGNFTPLVAHLLLQ